MNMTTIDIDLIKRLYEEYKNRPNHKEILNKYIDFCRGCSDNIDEILDNYPGFINKGKNPVAGIGFGTSGLTEECKGNITKKWSQYVPLLVRIKTEINITNVENLSKQIQDDRGHILNLFVNRCIITFHNTELLSITNIDHVKFLYSCLNSSEWGLSYEEDDNKNIEWYNNNQTLFNKLCEKLDIKEEDKAELSYFGWFLKEKLIQLFSQQKMLENCKNLILTGAPGTGKTYMAKEIAVEIAKSNTSPLSPYNDVEKDFIELKKQGFVDFVQFHPSYDYSDFVEGLRPKASVDGFERKDGIFKAFCAKAANDFNNNKENKYVFIIDEINRGEISKVLGELFFSIDPGYRGKKGIVNTQYQNLIPSKIKEEDNPDPFKDGFYVPDNIYVIGTMNDIDRSVESMDFAFRRRFAFYEVTAEDSMKMLWNTNSWKDSNGSVIEGIQEVIPVLEKKMTKLNEEIIKSQYGLSPAYQIGASYFLNWKHYKDDENPFDSLWKYHLEGLLFEYLRGKANAPELLKALKDVYYKAK